MPSRTTPRYAIKGQLQQAPWPETTVTSRAGPRQVHRPSARGIAPRPGRTVRACLGVQAGACEQVMLDGAVVIAGSNQTG